MKFDHLIKKLTPGFIRNYQRQKRDERFSQSFSNLNNKQAFEKIYEEKLWGSSDNSGLKYCSGDGSHDTDLVNAYVETLRGYLSKLPNIKSGVDLGCGDFNVGSRICDKFETYTAIDVAETVIKENKKTYKQKGLSFLCKNMTEDELPKADVAFVRQVLQHLSNADIAKFLENIYGNYQYLIVTESMTDSWGYKPNKDIITGPGIRIHKKSAVDISKPPFNFTYVQEETILQYKKRKELITTKIYMMV